MPLSEDRFPTPAPDPGRFKQLKLHEMAMGYAGALYRRLCMLAAELAEALGRKINAADWDAVAWARYFRLSLGETLQAVLDEQRGGSASPFIEAVCAAFTDDLASARSSSGSLDPQTAEFQSFAEFLAERRAPAQTGDPAHLAAAAAIAEARVGELLALADLRAVEDVCEELLTVVFHWDGRRFAITGSRTAEVQNLVERSLSSGPDRGTPGGIASYKCAFKTALAILFFWREPAPGVVARLKRGYAALSTLIPDLFPSKARSEKQRLDKAVSRGEGTGGRERELAEEIEVFCRILGVLREAVEERSADGMKGRMTGNVHRPHDGPQAHPSR